MKKLAIKLLCCILAVILLFSAVFSTACFAATKKGPVIDVAVSPMDDTDAEYVKVDISFSENPGIGAMTFTLLYDNTTFSAAPYFIKKYFYEVPDTTIKKYLIVNHPGDGYVSIVWSPEGNDNLYYGTGVAFRLIFRVDRSISGKHPFEIGNIQPITRGKDLSGCFSDFEHNTFTPVANNDSYVIGGNNTVPDSYPWKDKNTEPGGTTTDPIGEHTHNFTLHKKVSPSCTTGGYSVYECTVCGEKQTKDSVSALGHSFNDFWTVDRAADDSVAMKLSRHCERCSAAKDVVYYTLDEIKNRGIKNTVGTKVYQNNDNGLVKNESGVSVTDDDTAEVIEVDPETIKGAEELIEAAKEKAESKTATGKVKKAYGFFGKLYMYLFGTKSKPGIFRIIYLAILDFFGL